MVRWREAMAAALYGEDGFFVRPGAAPAAHFRTSVQASPVFADALLRLLERIDHALAYPDPLPVVDVGAGRGELLASLQAAAPAPLARRLRPIAVELARPGHLPAGEWRRSLPEDPVPGLLVATEWLDNLPVDVAEVDGHGVPRYVHVDPASGEETLGEPVAGADAAWLADWWPLSEPGARAEIGHPRDAAWAGAVATVARGLALAVDYGHLAGGRPPLGTLTGFRAGREVTPVPDGSCDLTAHVAFDAVAHAGRSPGGAAPALLRQAAALHRLAVRGTRPPLALARRDPAGYLHRLAAAGAAAELTDPAGLGGHYWLLQPVRMPSGWDPLGQT